ncbi:Uncharacterised protein [Suttonella ornithocola]|uniref:Uncharacterized protein n=1 Tax=Suttonella ornithocola TaxID=279832 RepID=A0A380MNA7_9GAMM|nr:Uncharacterised protein [Suttonella ornithocola]
MAIYTFNDITPQLSDTAWVHEMAMLVEKLA